MRVLPILLLLYLLQSCDVHPVVVPIRCDTLSSKDLSRENVSWVNDMNSAIKNALPNQKVYLVSAVIPHEGIANFMQDLYLAVDKENIR